MTGMGAGVSRRWMLGAGAALIGAPAALAATAPVFDIDSSEAPQLAAWAEQVRRRAQAWWPIIAEALASPGYVPPDRIIFALSNTLPSGWAGPKAPTTVNLNVAVSTARPARLDYIAHELTHVAQTYRGPQKRWLFEGVADYVRYDVLFPLDPERFFKAEGASYLRGFNMAAALLDWVERAKGLGSVRRLNAAMREGQDGEAALQTIAGMPLDDAWAMTLASLTEGSPAPHA